MPSYSAQFKEQAVRRLKPPNSQTISVVSRSLKISVAALYAWKLQFESKGFAVPPQ
jgi:transposase